MISVQAEPHFQTSPRTEKALELWPLALKFMCVGIIIHFLNKPEDIRRLAKSPLPIEKSKSYSRPLSPCCSRAGSSACDCPPPPSLCCSGGNLGVSAPDVYCGNRDGSFERSDPTECPPPLLGCCSASPPLVPSRIGPLPLENCAGEAPLLVKLSW
jgi:hypothetical protein